MSSKQRLIHYTDKEFSLEPVKYKQSDLSWQAKPTGLWVSVEGEDDWKWWCEAENFRLNYLTVSYEVDLKEDANIFHIKTAEEIFNFTKEYPYLREQWDDPKGKDFCQGYELDWNKVKSKYQGIIIAPYQRGCMLSPESNWYYGWDCASGCIWNLDCIKEFKLMENNEYN